MNQVFPNVQLPRIIERTVTPVTHWKLFTNDFTPDATSVLADFTEAGWTGYFEVQILVAEWLDTGVAGGVDLWVHAPISFLNGSGADQTAFGYYATDDGGELLLAARFDAGGLTRADGEAWFVIPTIGDFSSEL